MSFLFNLILTVQLVSAVAMMPWGDKPPKTAP